MSMPSCSHLMTQNWVSERSAEPPEPSVESRPPTADGTWPRPMRASPFEVLAAQEQEPPQRAWLVFSAPLERQEFRPLLPLPAESPEAELPDAPQDAPRRSFAG